MPPRKEGGPKSRVFIGCGLLGLFLLLAWIISSIYGRHLLGRASITHPIGGVEGLAKKNPPDFTQRVLSSRVCGSPAVGGYAHINATCLAASPTNQWYQAYYKGGGKQADLVVHYEQAASYDGIAVAWGLTNKKASKEECAAHCSKHMPGDIPGPFSNLPCNAFAFCPDDVCWEPDAHRHTKGDCWLKFTEGPANPEVNVRGDLPPAMRQRHPNAPARLQWVSGVLLPPGVKLGNGTWSPRYNW